MHCWDRCIRHVAHPYHTPSSGHRARRHLICDAPDAVALNFSNSERIIEAANDGPHETGASLTHQSCILTVKQHQPAGTGIKQKAFDLARFQLHGSTRSMLLEIHGELLRDLIRKHLVQATNCLLA